MLESSAGILQGFVEVALSPIKAAAKVRAKAHAARCHRKRAKTEGAKGRHWSATPPKLCRPRPKIRGHNASLPRWTGGLGVCPTSGAPRRCHRHAKHPAPVPHRCWLPGWRAIRSPAIVKKSAFFY